jgi:hypothetical protein
MAALDQTAIPDHQTALDAANFYQHALNRRHAAVKAMFGYLVKGRAQGGKKLNHWVLSARMTGWPHEFIGPVGAPWTLNMGKTA